MMDFVIAEIAESNRRWVSEKVNDMTDKFMADVMQKRAQHHAGDDNLEGKQAAPAQIGQQGAGMAIVDEKGLHPPLHPAGALAHPTGQGLGRILPGHGCAGAAGEAPPRQSHPQIGVFGNIIGVPAPNGAQARQPEMRPYVSNAPTNVSHGAINSITLGDIPMDAMKVRKLAGSALGAFETLDVETAVEVALWDLVELLEHVADDPASIALVRRIEGRIRGEGFFGKANGVRLGDSELLPLVSTEHPHAGDLIASDQ